MTSSGREVMKWLALVLMTGDHVNTILFDGSQPWLSHVSRVVFPIFAAVLAWNLTQHAEVGASGHVMPAPATERALLRLFAAGVLVQPLHALAFGYWLPVNVLVTLAAGVWVAASSSLLVALLVWFVFGLFVDYGWAGIGVVVAAAFLGRTNGHWKGWAVFGISLLGLCWWNGNAWALLALPVLALGGRWPWPIPRWRWTFLAYYAAHLAALAAVAKAIGT